MVLSCNTIKQEIQIKQFESKKEITLWYSKKMKTISVISIPIQTEITNFFSKKITFLNYKYIYGNKLKGNPMKMYLVKNNKLIKQSISRKKPINAKSSKQFLIYTKHFVDTVKYSRSYFNPYIKKMLRENKDTLHIGTVSEFKQKHSKLFKKLTENDSISIQFLDNDKFGERITIPVKW